MCIVPEQSTLPQANEFKGDSNEIGIQQDYYKIRFLKEVIMSWSNEEIKMYVYSC